jgi:hypothetical protein
MTFFMRPAEPADRPPHGGFAQVLALVLGPPGAVLEHGGVRLSLEPGAQAGFLLWANAARVARDRLGRERARRTLLHHGAFDRGHRHIKSASDFSCCLA